MSVARAPLLLVAILAATVSAGWGALRKARRGAASTTPGASAAGPSEAAGATPTGPTTQAAVDPSMEALERGPLPLEAAGPSGPSRTFGGDAARRHRSAFAGPATADLAFAYEAGGPVEAAPALTDGGDAIVASLSGRVARLTPTGKVVWAAELGERIYASPLLSGDAVLLGVDGGRFVSLSAATGKTRWSLAVDGDADTAAAEGPNGLIVFAAGRTVYGVGAAGSIRFRVRVERKVFSSPAVAPDGTVYVGSQDDHLYALSPRGEILWRRDLGADVDCAPAVGERGLVYVGTDGGQVWAFDRAGTARFHVAVGGFVRGGLTVTRRGDVLAGTYGPAPRVVALDGETGAERWSFGIQGTGAAEFGIHGAPLEDAAGNLYFGAQDDAVYSLDRRGRLRWSFPTGGDVDAPLVIGPTGVLYAGSDDGHLYALR